jgi:flagellar basal-body rod protein FlgB
MERDDRFRNWSAGMDLGSFDLFKGIAAKMSWLTQRQSVIAQNIANVDTPQYQSKDLAPLDFKNTLAQKLAPQRTSALHLAGTQSTGSAREGKDKSPYEVTLSGNTVSVEEQMQKAATTGIDFQMIATLYQKNIGLIKTALDRGGSNG